jgi:uncharacterized protein GlcG (DUF336 family)
MGLPLEKARSCIERGLAKARQLGFAVAVAIVDDGGRLVACDRMDEALWVTPDIARAKASAAAAFRTTTEELEKRFAGARELFAGNVAGLEGYQFVFGKGATPIVEGGRIVGAVGVSGAVPADNDQAIADAAAGEPFVPGGHGH